MEEFSWGNPNVVLLTLRCMEKRFSENFIKYGRLKFNTPKVWEEWLKKGRGDTYEGTLAFCSKKNPSQCDVLSKKYPSAYRYETDGRVLLKDQRDMNLPCLCFFTLKQKNFKVPTREGFQKLSTTIEGRYFQDCADNMTEDEIAALPEKNKPSMVVIQDFDEFLRRLKKELVKRGLNEDQIIVRHISYIDFSMFGTDEEWRDFNRSAPEELFVKSEEFSYQNELRILINTDDPNQLKIFEDTIDIGNLADIARETEGYHKEGITVECKVNICFTE